MSQTEPLLAGFEQTRWGDTIVVNATGGAVSMDGIIGELDVSADVQAQLQTWRRDVTRSPSRAGGIADRDRYLKPNSVFGQMKLAREALHDDIVGSVADESEALAFTNVSIFSPDETEEEHWNKIAAHIDLDTVLRVAWNILFTDSQFVAATWWKELEIKPEKGPGGGTPRKPVMVDAPDAITFFDTTKVTPVGNLLWGRNQMAYIADIEEAQRFDQILGTSAPVDSPAVYRSRFRFSGQPIPFGASQAVVPARATADMAELDPRVTQQLILGRYNPSLAERSELQADGVQCDNLYLLNPKNVWRHTLTKPPTQRFAHVRLARVFELLDLKSQLRQSDRVHLLGGANFILLVTKGTDQLPAEQPEIDNLRAQADQIGVTSPVMVGDHRLKVEIITPRLDVVLSAEKYKVINEGIYATLYQSLTPGGSAHHDDPMKMARLVATGLASKRKMLRRAVERDIIQATRDRNPTVFRRRASMLFTPNNIQLTFDSAFATFVSDGHLSGDISRETYLGEFNFDQERELIRRKREAASGADDVFQTTNPYGASSGDGSSGGGSTDVARRVGGRARGGTRNGGGAAPPDTNQGGRNQSEPVDPRTGRRSRLAAAATAAREFLAALDEADDDDDEGTDD